MIRAPSPLVSITVSAVLVSLSSFICQACNPVSQMSQCFSCHGSAHKRLCVSHSSLQTQVLHRPVNGFVRWPFHRAGHKDRQGTAISMCVSLLVCACTCACFSHRHQELVQEIKGHTSILQRHVSAKFLSGFSVGQHNSVSCHSVLSLSDMSFYEKIMTCNSNPNNCLRVVYLL